MNNIVTIIISCIPQSNMENTDVNPISGSIIRENDLQKMRFEKWYNEIDAAMHFSIPTDVLKIVTDYAMLFDVCFKPSQHCVSSNDGRIITISGIYLSPVTFLRDKYSTVLLTKYPLSESQTQWSIRTECPASAPSLSIAFGISKFRKNGELLDYKEIRSFAPQYVYERNRDKRKYTNDLEPFSRAKLVVAFDVNLDNGTISIAVNGKKFENVFGVVEDLGVWIAHVDVWSFSSPMTVTLR